VSDEATIRIGVHRQNIRRYKFLLATPLTDLERAFINRRIAEEEGEVRRLAARRPTASTGAHRNAPFHSAITANDRVTSG
jgi:hypothetical protein